MKSTKKKQRELFEDELLFQNIEEDRIEFPIFFKNKLETIFTRYDENNKYERLTFNKDQESFNGTIQFGFDETIKSVGDDRKLWYYLLVRNHDQIEAQEYEKAYERMLEGREEFFTGHKYQYVELCLNEAPVIKHRWKPIEK